MKKTGIKVLIVLLGLTSPISTDMCLPALPSIAAHFDQSYSTTNLIIIIFFLFMALSMLVSGPMSDRYGRKRILIVSLVLFSLGNILCAGAINLWTLVVARAMAACGAGGMMSGSTALVKDSFEGRERNKTLAVVQAFHIIGPLVAPILGALLISFFSWRVSFVVLAVVGCASLILTITEKGIKTGRDTDSLTLRATYGRMAIILRNKGFTILLVVAGLTQACFMAYLVTSSYIYTVEFGTTETMYSLFFAASALCTILGPRIYLNVYEKFTPRRIYAVCLVVIVSSGLLVALLGWINPWIFWLCFVWVPLANSIARPLITALLLKQHEGDTGSLSSLINFGIYLVGLMGMVAGSLAGGSYTLALGIIVVVAGTLSLVIFIALMRSKIPIEAINSIPE